MDELFVLFKENMDFERKVVLEKCVFNPTAAVFVPKALIPGSDIQR